MLIGDAVICSPALPQKRKSFVLYLPRFALMGCALGVGLSLQTRSGQRPVLARSRESCRAGGGFGQVLQAPAERSRFVENQVLANSRAEISHGMYNVNAANTTISGVASGSLQPQIFPCVGLCRRWICRHGINGLGLPDLRFTIWRSQSGASPVYALGHILSLLPRRVSSWEWVIAGSILPRISGALMTQVLISPANTAISVLSGCSNLSQAITQTLLCAPPFSPTPSFPPPSIMTDLSNIPANRSFPWTLVPRVPLSFFPVTLPVSQHGSEGLGAVFWGGGAQVVSLVHISRGSLGVGAAHLLPLARTVSSCAPRFLPVARTEPAQDRRVQTHAGLVPRAPSLRWLHRHQH